LHTRRLEGKEKKALKHSSNSKLAYRDEGSGPAILLVHGWGVSGALFQGQWEALSGQHRLLVPDLPGHGSSKSFPPDAPFCYLADSIAELIREISPGPVCLVGWSLGAMVCWDLLSRHEDLPVSGLVTIDMVPKILNTPDWWFGLREGSGPEVFDRHVGLMRTDWVAYTALFVPRIFSQLNCAQHPELIEKTRAAAGANHPDSMATIWQRLAEQDLRPQLADIHVPCCVVAGTQSQLYSVAACRWVTAQIEGARLVVFSRSGHAPHLEEPELFNSTLLAFASGLDDQSHEQGTASVEAGAHMT
jgi:pimeloyl-[acyl-carrier protein] methyl ester esterase